MNKITEKKKEKPICKKCKGPVVRGHFETACEKCDPFDFQPCRKCGTSRIFCCC